MRMGWGYSLLRIAIIRLAIPDQTGIGLLTFFQILRIGHSSVSNYIDYLDIWIATSLPFNMKDYELAGVIGDSDLLLTYTSVLGHIHRYWGILLTSLFDFY